MCIHFVHDFLALLGKLVVIPAIHEAPMISLITNEERQIITRCVSKIVIKH